MNVYLMAPVCYELHHALTEVQNYFLHTSVYFYVGYQRCLYTIAASTFGMTPLLCDS